MTEQPDLLTWAEAQLARDEGMEHATQGAGEDWHAYAVSFIEDEARRRQLIHVDDLWEAGLERPEQPKALGPAILAAARAGIIEKTGDYRPSRSSNLLPKPVWRSLIYGTPPTERNPK